MYSFIDVTEASEGAVLPSEALMINGQYIEDQIPGYRTLQVVGREALSPDVVSFETGAKDGSRLKYKRYPERILIITYQLICGSSEEFREAYNELGRILDVKDAELIFADEPDKFFRGTPCTMGEVKPGRNAVTGKFEILCTDPFKYSVTEYEAEQSLDDGSILLDYNGTYKAYPTLQAEFYSEVDVEEDGETEGTLTGNGDCGYVAFFTEDEKIVQLGDPDEVDGEAAAKSQTLVNQPFTATTTWGTKAKALWAVNNGVIEDSNVQQIGTVGISASGYSGGSDASSTSGTLLKAKSTASSPAINYTVKAKASGRTSNSVKVALTITASLANDGSYFGNGLGLKGSVYIGGAWHEVTLKKTGEYWRGRTGHTKNLSVTVTGLSASATSISGIKFKAFRSDSNGTAGTLAETACSALKINAYSASTASGYFMNCTSYGTASGAWHGATITRTIPADAAGDVGARDFVLSYRQYMAIGSGTAGTKQMGAFQAVLSDASGNFVAGVRVRKNKVGKNATLLLWTNDYAKAYSTTIALSALGTSTITKSKGKVTFAVGGVKKVLTNDDIAESIATKISFSFEAYSSSTPLAKNGLFSVKFVKNSCDTWADIPNKFSAGDIVSANCRNGEILLNGIPAPELGALGNDWEGFVLTPGLNQIGVAYSDFVGDGYEPTFTVRYREVFL